MKLFLPLILLCLVSLGACHKKDSVTIKGDYMVIGEAGGFVGLANHTYYIINQGQVRKDVSKWNNVVPNNISQFDFSEVMPASKYDSVKDLLSSIPPELLSKNNQDIGGSYPDAGFTDIRASINGMTYRWTFEGDQSASSAAIQQFLTKTGVIFE